jgi:hypothetical protein
LLNEFKVLKQYSITFCELPPVKTPHSFNLLAIIPESMRTSKSKERRVFKQQTTLHENTIKNWIKTLKSQTINLVPNHESLSLMEPAHHWPRQQAQPNPSANPLNNRGTLNINRRNGTQKSNNPPEATILRDDITQPVTPLHGKREWSGAKKSRLDTFPHAKQKCEKSARRASLIPRNRRNPQFNCVILCEVSLDTHNTSSLRIHYRQSQNNYSDFGHSVPRLPYYRCHKPHSVVAKDAAVASSKDAVPSTPQATQDNSGHSQLHRPDIKYLNKDVHKISKQYKNKQPPTQRTLHKIKFMEKQ